MNTIKEIITKSQKDNTFTIIEDDYAAVLLFEGKTILCSEHEDFHGGKEDAYFNKEIIKKSWKSPLELYQRIKTQFKLKTELFEFYTQEDLYSYFSDKDLVCSDDEFLP